MDNTCKKCGKDFKTFLFEKDECKTCSWESIEIGAWD